MKSLAKTTLFAAIAIASVSIAGTTDPRVSDSRYLEYGKQFHCVARLSVRQEDGKTAYASAVAIDPHYVVTAAHVVSDTDQWAVELDGRRFPLDRIVIHEDYSEDRLGNDDIAIGHSDKDFGLEFYPALYGHDNEAGQVCSISGYGIAGTHSTGAVLSDSRRRAGSNVIDKTERGCLICSVDGRQPTELEFLISPGDSGGGLFLGNALAGINSFVSADGRSPRSRHGEESGHTRISLHVEWIRGQISR